MQLSSPSRRPLLRPRRDGGEDPVAVSADGAGEADERREPALERRREPRIKVGLEGHALVKLPRGLGDDGVAEASELGEDALGGTVGLAG
jgi:hypothetical protein